MKGYADLGPLDEGKRIETIGDAAMRLKKTVGFIVDNETIADRYIEKLKAKFPGIDVQRKLLNCPVKGVVTVKVGPPPP